MIFKPLLETYKYGDLESTWVDTPIPKALQTEPIPLRTFRQNCHRQYSDVLEMLNREKKLNDCGAHTVIHQSVTRKSIPARM